MEKIIADLNWRYATKKFDSSKKVSEEDLNELLESLRLSPSSFGLEPWKFIVITNKDLREKLKEASWNQLQITDSSNLVVLCARKNIDKDYIEEFVKRISSIRNLPSKALEGYEEMLKGFIKNRNQENLEGWSKKQVYIALGFLLSSAAAKRIDACPMEGFDSDKYDEILGLKNSDYTSSVICALGYRSEEDSAKDLKKVRFKKEEVFEFKN